ncbi:hypothetical protein Ancab_026705 [Ancistrocladus abbreviatus]
MEALRLQQRRERQADQATAIKPTTHTMAHKSATKTIIISEQAANGGSSMGGDIDGARSILEGAIVLVGLPFA